MPDLPRLPPDAWARIELVKSGSAERLRKNNAFIRSTFVKGEEDEGSYFQVPLCFNYADYIADVFFAHINEYIKCFNLQRGFEELNPASWSIIISTHTLWVESGGHPEYKDYFVETAYKVIKKDERYREFLARLASAGLDANESPRIGNRPKSEETVAGADTSGATSSGGNENRPMTASGHEGSRESTAPAGTAGMRSADGPADPVIQSLETGGDTGEPPLQRGLRSGLAQLSSAGLAAFDKSVTDDAYLDAHSDFASLCADAYEAELPSGKSCNLPKVHAAAVRLSRRLAELAEKYFDDFVGRIHQFSPRAISALSDAALTSKWRDAVVQKFAARLWRDVNEIWAEWLAAMNGMSGGAAYGSKVGTSHDQEYLTLVSHERRMRTVLCKIGDRHSIPADVINEALAAGDVRISVIGVDARSSTAPGAPNPDGNETEPLTTMEPTAPVAQNATVAGIGHGKPKFGPTPDEKGAPPGSSCPTVSGTSMDTQVNAFEDQGAKKITPETNGPRREGPKDNREQRLQEFVNSHPGASLADIKYSADVHTPEFQDWRAGRLKSSSIMSGRIEDVLAGRQQLKKKPRKQRTDGF